MPSTLITDAVIAKAKGPVKIFDTEIAGLYAYVSAKGGATFFYKFGFPQRTLPVGVYAGDMKAIRKAAKVLIGKIASGDVTPETHREERAKDALTFNDVADEYIAYLSRPVTRFGVEMGFKKSWKNDVSYLKRPRAAFGTKPIREVSARDIQAVLNTLIKAGMIQGSINIRVTLYSLFRWAAGPDLGYVIGNPCANLNKRPVIEEDDIDDGRRLDRNELRTFWHGLDSGDLRDRRDRRVALVCKLILATMLRPSEVLNIRRSDIKVWDDMKGGDGKIAVRILPQFVKKGRTIIQPLNSLALEAINELLAMPTKNDMLIPPGSRGGFLKIAELGAALRGHAAYPKKGLCPHLGIAQITAHQLRGTSATHLSLNWEGTEFTAQSMVDIGRCLDHRPGKGKGNVTLRYALGDVIEMTQRRRVTLEHLDRLLRAIIGKPPVTNVVNIRKAA